MFRLPKKALLRLAAGLNGLLYQERAQTLSEYALLVSLVGVAAVVVGVVAFRETLIYGYDAMSNCLTGHCGSG